MTRGLKASAFILALDPGTKTGWATSDGKSGSKDLTPNKAKKRPPTPAEPESSRCYRAYSLVRRIVLDSGLSVEEAYEKGWHMAVEGAASFQRGKSAVRVGHELRGALKVACHFYGGTYVEVQPGDLKRFATGSAVADKPAMLKAARDRLGYEGEDEDEADALWVLAWAKEYVCGGKEEAT